jgi:hypothetical protein
MPPLFLAIFLLFRSLNNVLSRRRRNGVRITSLDHLREEQSSTGVRAILARRVICYPRWLSACFPSTHALPGCLETFPCTAWADILVNQITVSLLDPDTFPVIPVFTLPIAGNHPGVIIALAANAEDLAIIVGIRCVNVIMNFWSID